MNGNKLLGILVGMTIAQMAMAAPVAPHLTPLESPKGLENAQWLADDRFWPGADRLRIDARGLHVLDAKGNTLSLLEGRYEGLDHRSGEHGLLVATLDKKRQQAVLLALDAQHRWSTPRYIPGMGQALEGVCLYRDEARNEFAFLLGEEGQGEQWLVAVDERPLAEPLRVRGLSLPPQSGFCQVDDHSGSLYVNEEEVGLWRYAAAAEAPLWRTPVDIRQPFGGLAEAAAGMALVPGGLLVLDPQVPALHLYQAAGEDWKPVATLPLQGLDEPEQISARNGRQGLELLLVDEAGSHRGTLAWQPQAPKAVAALPVLPAQVQTDPVPSLGDAADDPAIWVDERDPARSRVLGTDKKGGLLVYDLAGKQLQDLRVGRMNNVDVRKGLRLGERTVDLAVASNRDRNSLHLFAIEPASGVLSELGQIATPLDDIYGLCMFKSRQGALYAIANDKDGRFLQYRLDGASGEVRGELVRSFRTASQPEGCVADDRNERLFVGEEDVAVWALDAREDAPATLEQVIAVGGLVKDDIEGLGLYAGKDRDYLVISSQGNDSYVVVEAQAPYRLRGAFRIGLNAARGIDGASETDGLDVTSANLGGPWSQGLLVVQDGRKRMPETAQNYKYLPWAAVAEALGLE
ncbi:phytase [Pseudomonas sp. ABC1]|uniref:phytase n=1 Tax=Pseudomonas sp. ABC1 TaxID=2748080 RepID=UPI0015C2D6A3|nr:phytase [Pseudomonas sp. ABC1]